MLGSSACRADTERHPWASRWVWETKWAELMPEWMGGRERWEATMPPSSGLTVPVDAGWEGGRAQWVDEGRGCGAPVQGWVGFCQRDKGEGKKVGGREAGTWSFVGLDGKEVIG